MGFRTAALAGCITVALAQLSNGPIAPSIPCASSVHRYATQRATATLNYTCDSPTSAQPPGAVQCQVIGPDFMMGQVSFPSLQSFSITAWLAFPSVAKNYMFTFLQVLDYANQANIAEFQQHGVYIGLTEQDISPGILVPSGAWVHYALVIAHNSSGTSARAYVNGSLVSFMSAIYQPPAGPYLLQFGYTNEPGTHAMSLYDLQVANVAFSDAQVSSMYMGHGCPSSSVASPARGVVQWQLLLGVLLPVGFVILTCGAVVCGRARKKASPPKKGASVLIL